MEYTGERYLPWEPNAQASYEHYHRYALAYPFARGKKVLDVASGEGYGAALLAQVAESVTGADVSAEAIAHASRQYGNDRLRFIEASIHNIPLANSSFDLITCFETIEHVHEQERALDELFRLLNDDGMLLISTPNRLVFQEGDKPWPWHVKEFEQREFEAFLKSKFKDVIFLGQKALTGSALWPLERNADANDAVSDTFIERTGEKTEFVNISKQNAMFFVAIASKKDLGEVRQALQRNYLVDVSSSLLKEKNALIAKLKADVATLDQMVRDKEQHLINLTNYYQPRQPQPSLLVRRPIQTQPVTGPSAVCTIASKNYLSLVRVFAKSMAQSNPDVPVYVLVVDRAEDQFDPTQEPYQTIFLEELENIPNRERMFFKYSPIELNTAVKPYFLEHLIQKFQIDQLCYFDPDIYVFSGLDQIWELLQNWSMVLTPHITSPYPDGGHPSEIEINLAGVFNLGFIGVSNTQATTHFLRWWQERLYDYCYMKPFQGMHVDQNWVNFAPVMYDDVYILRDLGYNIAYWNLHERARKLSFEHGTLSIDQHPAVFFHFSGFNPKIPDMISVHQNRFKMSDLPNVRPIYDFYREQVLAADYVAIKQWPYAFDRFDNGVRIPEAARTIYAQLDAHQLTKFGNPFSTNGKDSFFTWINQPIDDLVARGAPILTRLTMEIHHSRPDLQADFPDPLGANRLQFVNWLHENLISQLNLDPVFAPGYSSTQSGKTGVELHSLQFFTQRVARSIHQRLKQGAKDMLPADSRFFQRLRVFNAKYLERRVEFSLSPAPRPMRLQHSLPFGVNVAGYIQGEFGVAEVARASLKSLGAVQVPHVLNNVKTQVYREDDPTFAEFSATNPYRVNLIHVNADQAGVFANEKGPEYFQGRYNIGCWFWELSTFPKQWRSAFDYYQEIWVASGFCQESIASQSPIPVVKMTFPILIDDSEIQPNRKHFDLPKDQFIFGFVFDYHSLAERKNPYGLLKAFEMAFGDKKDALLVIKTINGEYVPEKVQKLREAAQSCGANIRFIDGYLPRHDAINLVASFDSFVSLHRSEGLGIGMAQAMRLGKPVIATGYSGNMDFMNHNNSYLVRYKLTELQENYGPYEKGNVWADPDLEHAATLMRQVYENRAAAQQIANRAALDIKTRMTPDVTGREMKERLLNIA